MATDIVGIGKAAEAVTQEIRELISLFLKPAATEAGEWLGDRVRIARQRNVERVMMSAKSKLEAAKIEIKPVRVKILIPLVEACSLEEDEEMIDRWTNLLAAAASHNSVLPSYVRILSELSPGEARILDCVQRLERDISKNPGLPVLAVDIKDVRLAIKLTDDDLRRSIVNLHRLELLRRCFEQPAFIAGDWPIAVQDGQFVGTTQFADEFLGVCNRPPQSKKH